ncbi:hypothetical protein DPMN_172513 [Dreissena polymorpha]|uniref:Uncharacterized protein n=1 Tax=Dreissena polymorpha TaxID=45954 RepID=A0A9D4E1S7_DREPO|nr:hypothetical protein DPMN_172513 [Dreissena polymorpha]
MVRLYSDNEVFVEKRTDSVLGETYGEAAFIVHREALKRYFSVHYKVKAVIKYPWRDEQTSSEQTFYEVTFYECPWREILPYKTYCEVKSKTCNVLRDSMSMERRKRDNISSISEPPVASTGDHVWYQENVLGDSQYPYTKRAPNPLRILTGTLVV